MVPLHEQVSSFGGSVFCQFLFDTAVFSARVMRLGVNLKYGGGMSRVQESKRREAEADRADSKMLEELGDDSRTAERRRLERTGKGLQMLMALIERRRASGFEVKKGLSPS